MMLPLAFAQGEQADKSVDTCVANFCLGNKELTFQSLKKEYGSGGSVSLDGDQKRLCYYDDQQKLWFLLEFNIHSHTRRTALETIFVSAEKICTKKIAPLSFLQDLKTNGDIRVGMPETELLNLKGQPTRVDSSVEREKQSRVSYAGTLYAPRFGEKVLVFLSDDQSKFNFFYITDGKIKSIWVSDAE